MEQYEIIVADKKIKERFLEVVSEKDYNREINFAIQAIRGNDALQKCDPSSIKAAIVNVALCGATLNPALQQAYLIPRKSRCCLDFSFRGLIQIAISSGGVLDIDASVVYAEDMFSYELGLNPVLIHKPFMGERTEKKYVYATAILPSNIRKFVVLDKKEIEAIKQTSIAFTKGASTPWKGEFEAEMWRKSAVKKLYKYLPQTTRMSTAISSVNEYEGISIAKHDDSKAKDIMKRFDIPVKEEEPPDEMIACPDASAMISSAICKECTKREGCPAWETTA